MPSWWQRAVLYQIYPRSFADSNGDGIGDLPGIVSRLDYLEWLGADGIWLNPTFPSPNADWGYDVADYYDVHPDLGTLADLDRLIAEAGARGIRVLLDLVPNHTSDRHAWFEESRSSRESPRRGWYIWRDPKPDGSPPTDWISVFGGGPAWELDEPTRQYYLHHFLKEQPDLDLWNEQVREAIDDVLRFWFERGVAGFRIDVAHEVVKRRELVDDHGEGEAGGHVDREETHAVHKRWRQVADAYEPERILVGETWVNDLRELVRFYGSGDDELHLAFNFPFAWAELAAAPLREVVERTEELLPVGAWPVWMLSSHDMVRFPTRMADEEEAKVRCMLLALLTLRGTPFLYYGDELGLRQTEIPAERVRDIDDRDGARTPMPWAPDGGWTDPWLPVGETARNIEDARRDPGSTLAFTRDLIALRRSRDDLLEGAYESLPSPAGVWSYRRGAATAVVLNLSDHESGFDLGGRVLISTDGSSSVPSRLPPWTGVVVDLERLVRGSSARRS